VMKIGNAPTRPDDRPNPPVQMIKVTVEGM
jgi:hypothetical protein